MQKLISTIILLIVGCIVSYFVDSKENPPCNEPKKEIRKQKDGTHEHKNKKTGTDSAS